MFLIPDFHYLVPNPHIFGFSSQSTTLKYLMEMCNRKVESRAMVKKGLDTDMRNQPFAI